MDLTKTTLFLSGLFIGSLLDTRTTLILVTVAMVIENKPLPEVMGGVTPQEILTSVVMRTGKGLKNFINNNKLAHKVD